MVRRAELVERGIAWQHFELVHVKLLVDFKRLCSWARNGHACEVKTTQLSRLRVQGLAHDIRIETDRFGARIYK